VLVTTTGSVGPDGCAGTNNVDSDLVTRSSGFLNGSLTRFALYNYTLTAQQVWAHYAAAFARRSVSSPRSSQRCSRRSRPCHLSCGRTRIAAFITSTTTATDGGSGSDAASLIAANASETGTAQITPNLIAASLADAASGDDEPVQAGSLHPKQPAPPTHHSRWLRMSPTPQLPPTPRT